MNVTKSVKKGNKKKNREYGKIEKRKQYKTKKNMFYWGKTKTNRKKNMTGLLGNKKQKK